MDPNSPGMESPVQEESALLRRQQRLGQLFRTLFLSRLRQMVEQGKLKIDGSGYIADLLSELSDQDWVVFVEGPPDPECTPATMLKYLTKYFTGGPISDKRIVGEEGGRI